MKVNSRGTRSKRSRPNLPRQSLAIRGAHQIRFTLSTIIILDVAAHAFHRANVIHVASLANAALPTVPGRGGGMRHRLER